MSKLLDQATILLKKQMLSNYLFRPMSCLTGAYARFWVYAMLGRAKIELTKVGGFQKMRLKIILAGLVLALAGTASAAPAIIDFSTGDANDSGTVSWVGGAAPLVGADLAIGKVNGVSTPSNNNTHVNVCDAAYPCTLNGDGGTDTGGVLNFTTGAFLGYNAATDTYNWGAGGTITITGFSAGCTTNGGCGGNHPDTESGPALLTGSVVAASYTDGLFDVVLAAGPDTKDQLLKNFYGLGSITGFNFSGTVHADIVDASQPGGKGTAFVADSTGSTDIKNAAVPELDSILLLGTMLIGSSTVLRRKLLKR